MAETTTTLDDILNFTTTLESVDLLKDAASQLQNSDFQESIRRSKESIEVIRTSIDVFFLLIISFICFCELFIYYYNLTIQHIFRIEEEKKFKL